MRIRSHNIAVSRVKRKAGTQLKAIRAALSLDSIILSESSTRHDMRALHRIIMIPRSKHSTPHLLVLLDLCFDLRCCIGELVAAIGFPEEVCLPHLHSWPYHFAIKG